MTALTTALRLVRKAFLGEELLLFPREDELARAIFTGEDFIFHRFTLHVGRAGLDATARCEFLQQGRGGERGAVTFIASARIRSLLCLLEILGREHAEPDRRPGGELHVHDSAGALSGDEIKVGRLPPDHRAERHECIESTAVDKISARQRELEATWNLKEADVIVGDLAIAQCALGAIDELLGEIGVETRRNDRKAPSGAVGRLRTCSAISLHEAATSSKMWPSFERLVSM